jgi:hypothetical protein
MSAQKMCENKNLGVVFMEITSLTPKNEWKSKICAQNLFQRLPLRWAISARSHTHTKTPQINIMWNPLFVSNLTHTKVNGWTERICRNLFRWNRGSKLLFDFWLDSVLRLQRLLETCFWTSIVRQCEQWTNHSEIQYENIVGHKGAGRQQSQI